MLFTAQKFVEKREKWDPWRSARFSTIGIFWVGPYVRFALNKINSLTKFWPAKARIQRVTVMNPFFGKSACYYPKKILLDQTFLMPVNMLVVNTVYPLLSGSSIKEACSVCSEKVFGIIQYGWCYWTPVSFILFALIKNEVKRFYLFNCFAYFWQIFLAFAVNNSFT